MKLPLQKIKCNGGTQPRTTIYDKVIAEYAEAMQEGASFPPLTVFYDGKEYWLADGFHRLGAAMNLNLDSIECDVHQGTLQDAQWFSFSVNKSHGLRRTNEDKARAVKAALQHCNGQKSNAEIARHISVSREMVSDHREQLESEGKITTAAHHAESARCDEAAAEPVDVGQPARVVTRKGKTYQMKVGQIGKAKKPSRRSSVKPMTVTREAQKMVPMQGVNLPLNNPKQAASSMFSVFEPDYLRAFASEILSILKERSL